MFGRRPAYADRTRPAMGDRRRGTVDSRGSGRASAARAVRMIASAVVTFIVIGILLEVLDANRSNSLVEVFTDIARWLVGPFDNLFRVAGDNWSVVINWGIAAIVYSVIGGFIAKLLLR